MILQIKDIRTLPSEDGTWQAWIDFSYFFGHGNTEGKAIDALQKVLHLKIDVPGRKS